MKNVTIIQLDINQGTQWGNDNTTKFIREQCVNSVKRYCEKNNYDHIVISNSLYHEKVGNLDFFHSKRKHYAFERYFYLNKYEYSVYLDNDIYVFDQAEPLPKISGIMCCTEPKSKSSNLFIENNQLPDNYLYYNSGMIMSDNKNSKLICEYMISRVRKYIRAKGKNTDNMMLNEYLYEHKDKIDFNLLDKKWNYMPFLDNNPKKILPNFYHFVGKGGKELISFFLEFKKKVPDLPLEYFLLNAEINLPFSHKN
jgi:hypothetical protein